MSVCGKPIRVAFGGNFVVDPEARSSLAGMRLLGTYMAGGQDLSQTDSANNVSRSLLERLGFRTIVPLSIHWARPLQPCHYAVYAMSRLAADPTLRARLGRNGRERVERLFDWEYKVDQILEIYRQASRACGEVPEQQGLTEHSGRGARIAERR